jgi:hypothetical protein
MPAFRPIRLFLVWLLPGQAVAAAIAGLAAASTPALAPAVLLSLGFLAFAVAVSAAARPPHRAPATDRQDAVLAVLDLRRNRGRYALVFALMGVAAGSGAVAASGLGAALSLSFGHGLLALALGFVSAWLILGEAACSQSAIRRALLGGRERT